ncbi:MAG: FIST C-terminal domain-containing protein [Propionivibrio sp.]
MTLATALVSGNDPLPQLAEQAVQQALATAGLTHANGVLLFLTPEFVRHAQAAVTTAARTAQCMQVAGGVAAGVFTESGWVLDRPAVAAMVFGNGLSLGHADTGDAPLLSYVDDAFPPAWEGSRQRFGGSWSGSSNHGEAAVWQQSRVAVPPQCTVRILGARLAIGVSSGLRLLGDAQRVEQSNGFDVERIGGQSASKSLERALPAELRWHAAQHLHQLTAVLIDGNGRRKTAPRDAHYRPVAIIAVNADHSLTLAEHVAPGHYLTWAMRQPAAAEADMRQTVARLTEREPSPLGALMFSCIGRGPFFYAGEDRDLIVLRERFPGLPIVGTYGTGQIAPADRLTRIGNRLLQNAVVTALITPLTETADVQSLP